MPKTTNVLIADDHALLRDAVMMTLDKNDKFACSTASNFEETKSNVIERSDIDIVMLDLVMPGMNGFTSLQTILDVAGEAKVVLFTGNVTT